MATTPQPTPLPFSRGTDGANRGSARVESLALRRWFRSHDRLRELSRAELDDLVADLSGRPDLWRPHVRHLEHERFYVRLLLTEHVEIWLICWCASQDTGFHDHDGSRGAVAVVDGKLRELLLAVCGPDPERIHPAGGRFSFGATHIHDVQHAHGPPATSLHAYSPPLGDMGFYEVASDGTLRRRAGEYREEFC